MSQKMLIDASHNEETRVVVLESKKVEDFDFESSKKLQLSGNIYLAKVTRVEPSLQAAFLDYGGNRHGFLAFSEIHPDYYQIPVEERLVVEKQDEPKAKSRKISRKKSIELKIDSELEGSEKISSEEILDLNSSVISDDQPTLSDENFSSTKMDTDGEAINVSDPDEVLSDEVFVKKQHRKFRIQEVIKVRQILLIQIVKEERGNKGAALTTYLSLAGRYCVLMPNTPRGGGISRKITNLADRKKLKEIANSLLVPEGSGLIIRTAGSNRTKLEIKRDYEYLIRQWEQVRDLTLSSIAPTTIYEEGSLIKRAIRDLYSRSTDEILVEGDRGYREAKDYMKMLMPSHAKNVKKYENTIPLFSKFQVEDHLAAMFNPIAQLRSGGYIVIDVTEALVAVDVNSGRATKESSIEDTALKTNLEAAEELSRQIKLRDLAGLIVIDFIDMEDRKNNMAVEKRMKDRLKNDRARTQVGRISMFGLLEMSRQRLRPGMIETSTEPCAHCHGTGVTRSDDSLSLAILRELEEEGLKNIYEELALQVPTKIANYMLNEKRDRIATIESRYNLSIKVEAENSLISPEYKLEKVKGLAKSPNLTSSIKIDTPLLKTEQDDAEDAELKKDDQTVNEEIALDDTQIKRRRRRRRKPKQRLLPNANQNENQTAASVEIDGTSSIAITSTDKITPTLDQPINSSTNRIEKNISRSTKSNLVISNDSKKIEEQTSVKPSSHQPNPLEKPKPKPKQTNRLINKKLSSQKPEEAAKVKNIKVAETVPKATTTATDKDKAKATTAVTNKGKAKATTTATEKAEAKEVPIIPKKKGWWSKSKKEKD